MTDTPPQITLEDHGLKGRYVIRPDGEGEEAELTYSRASDTLIIVDHTGVPDAFRGRGYGRFLAERVVADAREKGFKIVPLCPFFKAQADRHPDWADVISG
ncbi:GNAT family N-acetyltransferase [Erythrobacter ani]|uniref:N-acetyltransferase n=1 Tax=Erythrobacter ani TaxID=2827235 RepID=A0ABS6SKI9_9SPHN|nr:GNAT family N-acetyltransferase [Erythrobacter ani]MBV7265550.1 N-acetyltransferase [Erythrobacter ani]